MILAALYFKEMKSVYNKERDKKMKNILIIKAHQQYPIAKGELNLLMADSMEKFFNVHDCNVNKTDTSIAYDKKQEQEKFLWADTVIFQFPVFWFTAPATLHQYIQDVYEYGVFYSSSKEYGQGGLLKGKQYMFSTTWGASKDTFRAGLWEGCHTPDEVLLPLHKTQEYIGMSALPTFACLNVVQSNSVEKYKRALQEHLKEIMMLQ